CGRGGPDSKGMKRLRPASRAPSEEATGAARGSRDQTGNRWGLLPRIGLAVGGLAAGLVVVFAILIIATVGLRQRSLEARHAQQVIAAANGLQTLVIDFETGLRGFVITDQERYLSPWVAARRSYPKESADLLRLTKDEPQQHAAALRIKQLIDSYLQDYSVPFVAFVRRNPSSARVVAISQTGSQRVDAIRSHFASFLSAEQALGAARDARARRTAHAAILAASIALAAALTFLIGAAAYLVRAVARPVRLAAAVAERVAAGDLTGRLPTEGPGEVGQLERSFNTMADSLQRNRDDLEERNRRLVESERLKTELVSNVSHELRTPLASVLGFSDLLLKRDV